MSAARLYRRVCRPLLARLLGGALLLAAGGSEALTLGRVQGAVLLGEPLDVAVSVQMDPGETASALCFEADVFHADARQDASRVRVQVEAAGLPAGAQVRIRSAALINEPIVTVYLRSGCGQQATRRYVLLADLPSTVEAVAAPLLPLPAAELPAPTVAAAATSRVPAAAPPKRRVRPKPASPRRSAAAAAPSASVKPAGSPGERSRLTLDPLEFLSDRISNLEFAAPIATPEDVVQNKQKIQTLETTVTSLLALTASNEASLADLKARLKKAESSRSPNTLVYGLLLLLLACLVALALLWQRRHRPVGQGDWWRGAAPATAATAAPEPAEVPSPAGAEQAGVSMFSESVQDFKPSAAVDVKLMDMSDSYFHGLQASDVPASGHHPAPAAPAPVAPTPGKMRPVGLARNLHSEALLDIRQQAEFFVSLGQPEQAVRILKRQIQESEEPNPLLYLDLLGILHAQGLKADFQQVRAGFSRYFKGRVPEFAMFTSEGRGLEAYPQVLSRITAQWPGPQALALLERCIFKDSPDVDVDADVDAKPFDLAAFRELLLLHSLVPEAAPAPDLDLALPVISAAPELDLDLSVVHPAPTPDAPTPEAPQLAPRA